MVRTICCESHKTCGARCVNCPNLRENRAALEQFRQQESTIRLSRAASVMPSLSTSAPQPVSRIILPRAC